MRVTDTAITSGSLAGMESANWRLQQLNTQMSSGRKITKPSDNPAGTVQALELRGSVARNTQYTANANDAIGWMSSSDSTYMQINNLVQKARTLTVQGLNDGANTPSSNAALAQQIDAIRGSIISLANTTYNGRPIFGGITAGSQAYDANGNFVGDTSSATGGLIYRQVGDSTQVAINQTGPQVFITQPSPATNGTAIDLLGATGLLAQISSDLKNNTLSTDTANYATGGPLSDLDQAIKTVSAAQATEGATYNQVTAAQNAQTSTNLALTTELSGLQDIDLAQQAVLVSTANTNYQAALQTTANIRQTSLLDFLK